MKNKKKITKADMDDMVTMYDKFGLAQKFMALSSGKKLAVASVAVCLVIALIAGIVVVATPDYAAEVTLIEVSTGDITETITSTGTVVSKSKSLYKIFDGVKVEEVKVSLGEVVKKDQILATFDCDEAKALVEQKKDAYEQAKKTYEDGIKAAKEAKKTLPELEKELEVLEKEIEAAKAAEAAKGDTPPTEEEKSILERIEAIVENLSNFGINFDMSSMLGSDSESMTLQLEYVELLAQKATLEAQSNDTVQTVYKTIMDTSKKTYDDYLNTYNKLKDGWKAEKDGVVTALSITAGDAFSAQTSGSSGQSIDLNTIMSAMNEGIDVSQLVSSFTASNISTGIVIDNYDDFEIDFTISKYDIPKVKLNQKATVTALDEDFSGKVSYISPTISGSTGLDLGSIAGSLTGGGASGGGLDAKIKLDNPNSSVIIGLTVDIVIETSSVTGATIVPLEGIEIDGSSYYVYVYNEDSKTIEKRELEVGISSDTTYQIISGCQVGDKLVKNPTNALVDGSLVKVVG
ncbi:MAG: hypothetical protein IKA56_03720 [Clostridia bacterium]|nr:hypothetical protein [Clostridia bacterium]